MIAKFIAWLIMLGCGCLMLFVHVIFPNMILHESSFLGNTVAHAKAMVGYEEDLVRVTEYRERERKIEVRKARAEAEEASRERLKSIDEEIKDLEATLVEWPNTEMVVDNIHFRLDKLKMMKKNPRLEEKDVDHYVRTNWKLKGKL